MRDYALLMKALAAFLDHMEDAGYDPIGASDILGDAARWFRCTPEVHGMTPEAALRIFRRSAVYERYGLGDD